MYRLLCFSTTTCDFVNIILQATFSQFARPSAGLTDIPGKGSLDRSQGQEQVMGYSIRTEQVHWYKRSMQLAALPMYISLHNHIDM